MEELFRSHKSVSSTSTMEHRPQNETRKPLRARPGTGNLHRPSQPIILTDNEIGKRRKPKGAFEGAFDISEYMDKRGHEDFSKLQRNYEFSLS